MVRDIVDYKFYYYFVGLRQQNKLLSSTVVQIIQNEPINCNKAMVFLFKNK